MKTDRNIKLQVEKALETNLSLHGCKINVAVLESEVVLTGYVDKFCKKDIAKKVAKEVSGVKHITEEIVVTFKEDEVINDSDIVSSISDKYIRNFGNANKDIKVVVKDGYVWLEGRLKWKYQKELAEECISCLDGIKGIDNNIFIPEIIDIPISEKDIFAAIYGDHSINSDIKVEIVGHRVILKGNVENTDQKNLVTRLVRNVSGVKEIENFLGVNWSK